MLEPSVRVRPLSVAVFVLGALLVPLTASADIAPRPHYVEACVVENVQGAGELCVPCPQSMAADMMSCEARFEGTEMGFRCRTAGATNYTEIWCGPAPAEGEQGVEAEGSGASGALPERDAPSVQRAGFMTAVADAAPGGCSTSGRGAAAGGALICLALAAVSAGAIRRRRDGDDDPSAEG